MPSPDEKRARAHLERSLEELEAAGASRYVDRGSAVAMYQTSPSWLTAIVCTACLYVALIPTLPRKSLFTWECSQCGRTILLMPPLEALLVPGLGHA